PPRRNGKSAATSWTTRRGPGRCQRGKSGSTPTSSPSDPPPPGARDDGAVGHRARGAVAVQRVAIHPGLAEDRRAHHAQLRRCPDAPLSSLHPGHPPPPRAHHASHPPRRPSPPPPPGPPPAPP